jgi:hypothetical protein
MPLQARRAPVVWSVLNSEKLLASVWRRRSADRYEQIVVAREPQRPENVRDARGTARLAQGAYR